MNTKTIAAVTILFCCTAFSSQKPGVDSLDKLVRTYDLIASPGLVSGYQLTITEHNVSGLWDSLHIHLFKAEYRAGDGTWFRDEEFLYRNGQVQIFTGCFGGYGLMSGVMKGSVFYYTYSFGSGIHRTHLGRLFYDGDNLVQQESGGYAFIDFIVAEPTSDTLYLYRSVVKGFNDYTILPPPWGVVKETAKGITVVDTLGNEIKPDFPRTSVIHDGGEMKKRGMRGPLFLQTGIYLDERYFNLLGRRIATPRSQGMLVSPLCREMRLNTPGRF